MDGQVNNREAEFEREKAVVADKLRQIVNKFLGGQYRSDELTAYGLDKASEGGLIPAQGNVLQELCGVLENKIEDQSRAFEQNQKAILNMLEDLQESKDEILRSKVNFLNMVENNSDGIIVMDKKGILCFVNPVAERILGHSKEELLNNSVGYTLSPGEKREIEISREGQPKVLAEMRGESVLWEGSDAFMVTIRDVTYYRQAEEKIRESFEKLRRIQLETVQALSSAGEKRDPYTAGHQTRVSVLSCALARELNFQENDIEGIKIAGLLHDIGKIYVPDTVLTKPDKLDAVEFRMIKDHPQFGYDILKPIEFPWPIAQIVLQHHERIDGSGYPNNLKAPDILMEAKIVAVADVVEAMSCDRPYRPALSMDVVLNEITSKKGLLFDPTVVDACTRLFVEKNFKMPKQEIL